MIVKRQQSSASRKSGISQLTLVEHSLCPLEPPEGSFTHRAEYFSYGKNRRRQTCLAEVQCNGGLRPDDEFYLWAILGLACSQQKPTNDFYASARYILKSLGLSVGGTQVATLRQRLARLSQCHYRNPKFFDPKRRELRHVEFGFLSLDLPRGNESQRPWRIAFDAVFFDFCKASGYYLAFDLETYRSLRPASRRLFLLLKKLFYRRDKTHNFDVEHLAVHVLGFSRQRQAELNKKVFACAKELAAVGVVALPDGGLSAFCQRVEKGVYRVCFLRGPYFDKQGTAKTRLPMERQAQYDLLRDIGLNPTCIRRVLNECSPAAIIDWGDATLMARERWGPQFFRKNPAAFFWEGVQSGRRPPDWFLAEKKRQEQADWSKTRKALETFGLGATPQKDSRPRRERDFFSWILSDGQKELEQLTTAFGGDSDQAQEFLRKRFESERKADCEPQPVGELFRGI